MSSVPLNQYSTPNQNIFLRNRFFTGLAVPILFQLAIYESYLYLNPQRSPDFDIVYFFPIIIGFLVFLFLSLARMIYKSSGMSRAYQAYLVRRVDELFLREQAFLSVEEKILIRKRITKDLFPRLQQTLQENYVDSFLSRSHVIHTPSSHALTDWETIWIFFSFSTFLYLLDFILVLLLHFTSLIFIKDVFFLDQISSLAFVIIFSLIFLIAAIYSLNYAIVANRKIRTLIPLSLPTIFQKEDDFEKSRRELKLDIISRFPLSTLIPESTQRNQWIIREIYQKILIPEAQEALESFVREELGKRITWQFYSRILDEIKLPDKKKEAIEKSFMKSPLLETAKKITKSTREFQSLSGDIRYSREMITKWDKLSDGEKLTSYLFLYRSVETIFKNIVRSTHSSPPEGLTILKLTEILYTMNLLDKKDVNFLHLMRRRRNLLLHEPGRRVDITANEMQHLVNLVEQVLLAADFRID